MPSRAVRRRGSLPPWSICSRGSSPGRRPRRIRRANFLDLAAQALESCRRRLDEAMPAIENLRTAIDQQRGELSSALAGQIRGELLSARRPWENRLLGQVASRWGFSPFSLVLRLYQGIGGLASGALLYRARTPAQLALWGVVEGARTWQKHRRNRQLQQRPGQAAAGGFDATQLRRAAVVLEGYAAEAGLPKASASAGDARSRGRRGQLELRRPLVAGPRRPDRPAGPTAHGLVYPLALRDLASGDAGLLALPAGKEFLLRFLVAFHAHAAPIWGLESYLASAFWFVVWCFLLLWLFTRRLRGGLKQAVDRLAENWTGAAAASGVCAELEDDAAGPSSSGGNWKCFWAMSSDCGGKSKGRTGSEGRKQRTRSCRGFSRKGAKPQETQAWQKRETLARNWAFSRENKERYHEIPKERNSERKVVKGSETTVRIMSFSRLRRFMVS